MHWSEPQGHTCTLYSRIRDKFHVLQAKCNAVELRVEDIRFGFQETTALNPKGTPKSTSLRQCLSRFVVTIYQSGPLLKTAKCRSWQLRTPFVIVGAGLAQSEHWLGYGLEDRGSISGRGWEFLPSPSHPDRIRDPPSLLSNGYRGLLHRG
jgi:hypothetical protein